MRGRGRERARKREGKYQAYFAHRQRAEFYNCAGCELIAKLIGVAMRAMLSMCVCVCVSARTAFCASPYSSCSKCKMDFERGRFQQDQCFETRKFLLASRHAAVTNLSRPILVILMSSFFDECANESRAVSNSYRALR